MFPSLMILLALACRTPVDTAPPPDTGPFDADGDGHPAWLDCDDDDDAVHPGAAEACNGRDDDCDGEIDEGVLLTLWTDADGDGAGDPVQPSQGCAPGEGLVENAEDCDDADAAVHPGAEEVCDGRDQDCDGETDEGVLTDFWADFDADGWGDPAYHSTACEAPTGMVANDGDCDDSDAAIHPDAQEGCNEQDDDCDGTIDEECDG